MRDILPDGGIPEKQIMDWRHAIKGRSLLPLSEAWAGQAVVAAGGMVWSVAGKLFPRSLIVQPF